MKAHSLTSIETDLLEWYRANRRDLPWRATADPYPVLVSELMLQQTTVAAVIPYFRRWMERFPVVEELAKAEENEVMSYWQGLGYYSRCRSLHAIAKHVAIHGWPKTAKELESLKGIGPYTAGAIASIVWGESIPAVDANAARVFARINASALTGIDLNKAATEWIAACLQHVDQPGDFNQALMDLGSTICTASVANCSACPVHSHCLAAKTSSPTLFPILVPKKRPTLLRGEIFIPLSGEQVGVIPSPGPWWRGLHIFPTHIDTKFKFDLPEEGTLIGSITFPVTRYRIECKVQVAIDSQLDLEWIDLADIEQIALASPHRKALKLLAKMQPHLGI